MCIDLRQRCGHRLRLVDEALVVTHFFLGEVREHVVSCSVVVVGPRIGFLDKSVGLSKEELAEKELLLSLVVLIVRRHIEHEVVIDLGQDGTGQGAKRGNSSELLHLNYNRCIFQCKDTVLISRCKRALMAS